MKAKVIETGEIVEVEFYCSAYYKEKGQGPNRREWDEDELEFEPGPKMVSLDKVCEFLKTYRQDTYDGTGYIAGIINDKTIEDLRNKFK